VLRAQGDLEGARTHLERALAILVRVYGAREHPGIAASLHELAGVLRTQGDLGGARTSIERALAILVNVHGTEEHPDVAASLHALGHVLFLQGNLGGARARLERSLAIDTKVHGTQEHSSIATSLAGLAAVLESEGELDEAIATYNRALNIRSRVFGTRDHYMTAETEASLGMLLLKLDRHEEARELLSHAYEVFCAQVPNHPLMGDLRLLLGEVPEFDPVRLAWDALQSRHSGEAPSVAFFAGLSAMTQAGPPYDAVATIFDAIASKRPLTPVDASLPSSAASFVEQVLEVARQIDSAAGSTSP
jgi:tetratricopeptide (TPR) repeat protein